MHNSTQTDHWLLYGIHCNLNRLSQQEKCNCTCPSYVNPVMVPRAILLCNIQHNTVVILLDICWHWLMKQDKVELALESINYSLTTEHVETKDTNDSKGRLNMIYFCLKYVLYDTVIHQIHRLYHVVTSCNISYFVWCFTHHSRWSSPLRVSPTLSHPDAV